MTPSAAGLFLIGNAAALVLAALVAAWLCRDRALPVRWIATVSGYLLITCLSTLAVGLSGHLTPWSPTLAVTLATIVLLGVRWKTSRERLASLVPKLDPEFRRERLDALFTPLLALGIGLAAIWIVKYSLLGTYLTFDDKTYHAPSLVHWMETGRISLTAFSYQSYYPFNAELLTLWYMLPFGNDAVVPLTGLVYATLFVLVSLELGRRWNLPPWTRLIPGVLFLSSIEVLSQCNWFADVDIAAPVTILAALAIGCRDNCPARHRQALFAGALAGFAVGMKSTFAPYAGILMVIIASRIFLRCRVVDGSRERPLSIERLSFAGTAANGLGFFLMAALCGGYWYVRNIIHTGNPLYPAQVGPFDGPFSAAEQSGTSLAHAITHRELGSDEYVTIAELLLSWPATHAMLAVFAVVVCGLAVVRLRKGPRGSTAATAVTLTTFAVLCVAMFPWLPFSARGDDGNFYLAGSSRYLSLAYLCGFLLLPRLFAWVEDPQLGRLEQWMVLGGLLLLLTIPLGEALDTRFALCGLAVALGSLGVLQWIASSEHPLAVRGYRLPGRSGTWLAAGSAALLFVAAAAPINLRSTDRMHLETWMNARIDELPPGSTLTMYFGLRPEVYTLYGRRYQLDPVRLRADGLPAEALHVRRANRQDVDFFDMAFDRNTDVQPEIFLSNLRAVGVDFVVTPSMPHRDDAWPVQHGWLKQLGLPIHCQSDEAVIWDLRPHRLTSADPPADADEEVGAQP